MPIATVGPASVSTASMICSRRRRGGARLPVTTLARTVFDLAGTVSRSRLKLIVEEVVYGRRVPIVAVGAILARVRRRGKPGVHRLEGVLDLLSPGEAVPRSHLEFLLDSCLERTNLPRPIPEHPLPTTQNMAGFVDRLFPEALLIIEADGRKWHERSQAVTRDRERDMQAAAAGYQTIRPFWEHLESDPIGTARLIESIYDQRRRLISGP